MARSWVRRGVIAVGTLGAIGVVAIGALVAYASATYADGLQFPDTPYPELKASSDPEVIARGEYLVRGPAHCAQCHSTDDREHPEKIPTAPMAGGLSFDLGPLGSFYSRNLTPDPTTGIGRRTDAELARAIKTGVLPEGELSVWMRLSAATLSDDDIVAVISYLRAQPPVEHAVPDKQLTALGKVFVRFAFPALTPRDEQVVGAPPSPDGPTLARGEYLVEHVALCGNCHTEFDQATFQPIGPKAGGGTVEPSHGTDSDMEYAPPNLTAHPTGVTGRMSEDQFVARLRAGRVHASSIMPWEGIAVMTEDDMRSTYRYLRSLPPVDRDTGPSYRKIGWKPE